MKTLKTYRKEVRIKELIKDLSEIQEEIGNCTVKIGDISPVYGDFYTSPIEGINQAETLDLSIILV